MKIKSSTCSRRKCLKWLGVGAVSAIGALMVTPILRQNPLQGKRATDEQTQFKTLEQLLLDTGKEFLPKDLYHATLHSISHSPD